MNLINKNKKVPGFVVSQGAQEIYVTLTKNELDDAHKKNMFVVVTLRRKGKNKIYTY
jgi:hypothetical protein